MICALVLAAGRSRRMGTQKLLLPLAGMPVIARVVDELLRSPIERTFVVVGRDGERILQALPGRRVEFVTNPEAEGDMLSSVRCGLRAVPESCDAIVVALGDQPGLKAELVRRLIDAQRESGRSILVPTQGGKGGHPLLIAARHRDEILTRFDGIGLRGLIEAHAQEVATLEAGPGAILEDMDEPADYERMQARFAEGNQA